MFVYTISDLIVISMIVIGIAIIAFSAIWQFAIAPVVHKLFMHNCYKCANYKLSNVASCGDCCWHKCTIHNITDKSSFNCRDKWRRCKHYKA